MFVCVLWHFYQLRLRFETEICLFLYEAIQSVANFSIHLKGVVVDAHRFRSRLEVQSQRAVIASGNRDEFPVEYARIALRAPRLHLNECEVSIATQELIINSIRVASQYALVFLTRLHALLAAHHGLNVHGQLRVVVPTVEAGSLIVMHFYIWIKNALSHLHDDIERRVSSRARSRAQPLVRC